MKMQICVQGKSKKYYFDFDGEPEHLPEWWKQGLDVSVIMNEIPLCIPGGFVSLWCKVQDFFCREMS